NPIISQGRNVSLFLVCQRDAIPDRQHADADTRVRAELGVKRADRYRVDIVFAAVDHAAVPEYVVDRDQATGSHQDHAAFVIAEIVGFVGVDKSEVELTGFALADQTVESIEGGRQTQVDFIFQPRFFPVPARDGSPLLAHVAGNDLTIFGQRARD